MNGVLGMCTVLGGTDLSDEQAEYLSVIRKSADGLLGIIEDILDFSKIEAGKLELDEVETSIIDLVEDALDLFALGVTEKGVELLHHVAPDVPERMLVDPTRLRQILVNILGNAVKFTDEGQITLRVGAQHAGSDRVRVEVLVEDSGPGIDPLMQDHLFEAFNQLDSSTARKYGGTGLGLTISRKLARLMNGDLTLVNSSSKGTTFKLAIEAQVLSGGWLQPHVLEDSQPQNIVLLDPNPVTGKFYRDRFAALGADVTWMDLNGGLELSNLDPQALMIINHPERLAPNGDPIIDLVSSQADTSRIEAIILTSPGEHRNWTINGVEAVRYLMKPVRSVSLVHTLYPEKTSQPRRRVTPRALPSKELSVLLRKRRILVVDDNRTNLQVAKLLLKRHGFEVEVVTSGMEAIEQVQTHAPDVVFLDLQMPEMDGFETSRKILKVCDTAYIIAMTAAATVDDRRASEEAGMRDFVPKPIKEAELTRALWTYYHQLQTTQG
jgi:CheY-like chemotaxis protein